MCGNRAPEPGMTLCPPKNPAPRVIDKIFSILKLGHSFARKSMIDADWRSPGAYDYLDNLNWPSVAWECLRRDKEYHADFANSRFRAALDSGVAGAEQRWGLRFRRRPYAWRE